MRAAQRTGQVNRRRNSNSPDDCDLKYADLCAGRDCGADTPATEKDEQESSEEFADCPFWHRRVRHFDLGADMRRRFRPRGSDRFAHQSARARSGTASVAATARLRSDIVILALGFLRMPA